MRRILIGVVFLGACRNDKQAATGYPAQPVQRTATAGALDSLPHLELSNGRLVCLADANAPCQVTPATANWLGDGKYATWEPRKPILIWTPNKTDPEFLGEGGHGENQYDVVLSVAQTRGGYVVVSQTNGTARELIYDANGKYVSQLPVPPVGMTHARGFSGGIAFYQLIHEGGQDSAAVFEVREVDSPGDTVGVTVLKSKLTWLRLRDSRPITPVPLFATLPSYALAPDGDIVWSNSDLFNVERRSSNGVLRWSLTSNTPGPGITPEHIKALRARIAGDDKARFAQFDSSAAHTGNAFPALSGLFVGADGRVLVVGPQVPTRDSLDYVLLGNDGTPTGRFALPLRTRPLLYGGDSLLVQRPGANANSELRWLVIKKP